MSVQQPPLSYSDQKYMPAARRINVRMIVFLTFISVPFILVAGAFVRTSLNGGIVQDGDVAIVDLKMMGNFPFDPDHATEEAIPPRFRKLDGKRVQLQGFMAPPNAGGSRIGKFQFVYNVQKCCFNGPPQVQERVYIDLPQNRTLRYTDDYIKLTGILHVKVVRDDLGVVQSVYTLEYQHADAG